MVRDIKGTMSYHKKIADLIEQRKIEEIRQNNSEKQSDKEVTKINSKIEKGKLF